MDAATPFDAFDARSQIDVDDERISFQIPNKRIRADLVFYLPTRTYDHVAVKLLNGNVTFGRIGGKRCLYEINQRYDRFPQSRCYDVGD